MSNWDYLNVGLVVLSNSKMQMVKKTIQAVRYNGGLAIIDRRTHAIMRDYIFGISCDIEIIKKQFEQSPQQVYFFAKLIENRINQSGLRAGLFPDMADKELLVQLMYDVHKIVNTTSKKLDHKTINRANVATHYFFDLTLLKQVKNAKEAEEFLVWTESKYLFLNKQLRRRKTLLIFGILGLIVNIIGTIMILFVVGPMTFLSYFIALESDMITEGINQTIISAIILIFIVVLVSWALSLLFLWLGLWKNPETTKLFRLRELARKDQLPMDDWVKIKNRFGDLSSQEYASLFEERLDFLEPILGNRDQIHSSLYY